MSTFLVTTTVNAPVADVWAALGDIGGIHKWNPGVRASHTTSEIDSGLGATRYCDLGGKNYLDEEVVLWDPERSLTMRVTDTNLPFKSVDIRFTLEAIGDEATVVTCSPLYAVKYGPIGRVLDRFYLNSTYRKGMENLLAGLKAYVEENTVVA